MPVMLAPHWSSLPSFLGEHLSVFFIQPAVIWKTRYTAVQRQKAVSPHVTSEQILLFAFAEQYCQADHNVSTSQPIYLPHYWFSRASQAIVTKPKFERRTCIHIYFLYHFKEYPYILSIEVILYCMLFVFLIRLLACKLRKQEPLQMATARWHSISRRCVFYVILNVVFFLIRQIKTNFSR